MHIVVFPGWYPSRIDKFSGDFIQRHLQAVSLNCRVSVVIPVKDSSIKKTEIVRLNNGNLTEVYYYYPSISSIRFVDSIVSFIRYNYICYKAVRSLSAIEKLSLAHIYILQKNQCIGLLLRWRYKIPYVISEQSTSYIDGQWERSGWLQKKIARYAFLRASSFHAVSHFLLKAIKSKLQLSGEGIVIPNVVDTSQFFYKPIQDSNRVIFVHVSNMVYQKNIDGMLDAFAEVKKTNPKFVLNLVGPVKENVINQINELGLSENVVVWNERSYTEVAEIMQQSNVFVFFTRYETFGCVIIEANACGLPVIVSDLEVTRELITNTFNGLFAQSENVNDLAAQIIYSINNFPKFDPVLISLRTSERFDYNLVSNQFYDWYKNVCLKDT